MNICDACGHNEWFEQGTYTRAVDGNGLNPSGAVFTPDTYTCRNCGTQALGPVAFREQTDPQPPTQGTVNETNH